MQLENKLGQQIDAQTINAGLTKKIEDSKLPGFKYIP